MKHALPEQTQRSTSWGALVSKWGVQRVLSELDVQTDLASLHFESMK